MSIEEYSMLKDIFKAQTIKKNHLNYKNYTGIVQFTLITHTQEPMFLHQICEIELNDNFIQFKFDILTVDVPYLSEINDPVRCIQFYILYFI